MKPLTIFLKEKIYTQSYEDEGLSGKKTVDGPAIHEVFTSLGKGWSLNYIRNKWENEFEAVGMVDWLLDALQGVEIQSIKEVKKIDAKKPFLAIKDWGDDYGEENDWYGVPSDNMYLQVTFKKITPKFKKTIKGIFAHGVEFVYDL